LGIFDIDKTLDLKIEELFEYRAFGELYKLTGEKNSVLAKFHIQLKTLQASIYYLDAYLEENWNLDDGILESKWNTIYQCLNDIGVKPAKHKAYVAHIKMYEAHEKSIRQGILPQSYTMHHFYYYKSCDVKLMRRLILDNFPILRTLFSLSDWRIFDLVTEINDDATDIFEDLATINGNRILLMALNEGNERVGICFSDYLDLLYVKNKEFNYSSKSWCEKIKILTEENIHKTKTILSNNLNNFTSDHKLSARILPYLKLSNE
jgi:hypothetical protein